jgi:hypothetical protein
VQWLRKRVTQATIIRSVNRLLPKNGQPVEEDPEDKEELRKVLKKRARKVWLENFLKPADKFKNLRIKPKYFFTNLNYEKVVKLQRIFLEFDGDGSSKINSKLFYLHYRKA